MKHLIYRNYDELSKKTAEMIGQVIMEKPNSLLCFPAGHTSLGTFDYLVNMKKSGILNFGNCIFVGLDEWVGLEGPEGCCTEFMYKHLFDRLELRKDQIVFFDTNAEDLDAECKRIDQFVFSKGSIDVMFLGIGMNGHLGLNEPGVDPHKYCHITELDQVTSKVGQKYFDKNVQLSKGITIGIKHIMESKLVILQASELKKAEIIKKLMHQEPNSGLPATFLKNHSRAYLLLDAEAASLL